MRPWDLVHCPAGTRHVIVGAGTASCVVLAVGARERHAVRAADGALQAREDWGGYPVEQAALRHGAGVEHETTDAREAYARFPEARADASPRRLAARVAEAPPPSAPSATLGGCPPSRRSSH
ncbi:MAG: hypothetical protein M3P39_04155 [Actinomycetota bacterium]|nr:hypothetical protein [Actinomycetota bacterium]